MKSRILGVALVAALMSMTFGTQAGAEEILGKIKLSGGFVTSYTLTVQAFDDPQVQGVTCHVSDVVVGGLTLGGDPSNASIACRQTGEIKIAGATGSNRWGKLNLTMSGSDVFGKTKGWFKGLKVVRIVDTKRNVLIYVVYTPKWGKDSNKNVVSTISLYSAVSKQ